MNGIRALIRRDERELASSLSAVCHTMAELEDSHLQTRKWVFTGTKAASISMLGFLTSRTVRNTGWGQSRFTAVRMGNNMMINNNTRLINSVSCYS